MSTLQGEAVPSTVPSTLAKSPLTIPSNLTVYASAVCNAGYVQTITIADPASGNSATWTGKGEGNVTMSLTNDGLLSFGPSGQPFFSTSDREMTLRVTGKNLGPYPTKMKINGTIYHTAGRGEVYLWTVIMEDLQKPDDWNDTLLILMAWKPPTKLVTSPESTQTFPLTIGPKLFVSAYANSEQAQQITLTSSGKSATLSGSGRDNATMTIQSGNTLLQSGRGQPYFVAESATLDVSARNAGGSTAVEANFNSFGTSAGAFQIWSVVAETGVGATFDGCVLLIVAWDTSSTAS